ncbi:MAG: NAD(P)-binding domain-containing protein [Acidobacteria bacterium]|nr:NAD(P)-binding domain-containing protein [Acidobacteriota bacterium]
MDRYGFIGAGRVARIIVEAAIRAGAPPSSVLVTDPAPEPLAAITTAFPGIAVGQPDAVASSSSIVFLAVHPPVLESVLTGLASTLRPEAIVISLAPRVPFERILALLPPGTTAARLIPNAPAALGRGFNPVAFPESLPLDRRDEVLARLAFLGRLPVVPEEQLEGWAVITGMGPTYFWPQMLLLERLGAEFGLDAAELRQGVAETVAGSAVLLAEGSRTPAAVLDLVPFHPLREDEPAIAALWEERLRALYRKLTPGTAGVAGNSRP